MIKTDGIGVSVLFMKIKPNGLPIAKIMPAMAKQVKKIETVKYIEDIEITDVIRKKCFTIALKKPHHYLFPLYWGLFFRIIFLVFNCLNLAGLRNGQCSLILLIWTV